MNITFGIHKDYTQNFTSLNLIKNPIAIKHISAINNNTDPIGLVLTNVNNCYISNNEVKLSPVLWINPGYTEEYIHIVVPPNKTWNWYLIDNNGNTIESKYDLVVNIMAKIIHSENNCA